MQQLKEVALDPEHGLVSEEEKSEYFLSSELTEEQIEERYAKLLGKKKPKHLRTESDERALNAAEEKRRRKAEKRKREISNA